MKIEIGLYSATISGADGVVSEEGFTQDEIAWLDHQLWLLGETTANQSRSNLAHRMRDVFAALGNDTSAIILHRAQESASD